eukprot:6010671-Amphidinium_carterae.2
MHAKLNAKSKNTMPKRQDINAAFTKLLLDTSNILRSAAQVHSVIDDQHRLQLMRSALRAE